MACTTLYATPTARFQEINFLREKNKEKKGERGLQATIRVIPRNTESLPPPKV